MLRERRLAVALPVLAVLAAGALEAHVSAAAGRAGESVESMREALAAAPGSPALHERLGLALARSGDADGALAHAARALELRPTSPYSWAAYAESRYRAGMPDAAFELATVNAVALGPNEPEVQESVALYGLAVWDEVAPRTREAVDRAVEAAMRRDPAALLTIAERRGRLALACRHVPPTSRAPEKWNQICKGTEAR